MSDQHDEITKVLPQELESSDSEVATEYSAHSREPTRIESEKATASTAENEIQVPRTIDTKRKSKDEKLESHEFRIDLEPEVRTHAGTSPGVLLPEQEVRTVEKSPRTPPVRPVSLRSGESELTAPNAPDQDEYEAREDPTRTFAPEAKSKEDEEARGRGRADSLIDRIGVPANPVEKVEVMEPSSGNSRTEDSASRTPRVPPMRGSHQANAKFGGNRDKKLWVLAGVFGAIAVILTIVATIMFARSQ